MIKVEQTRELFSALISRPTLDDRLLQRPPFKFIHDIFVETMLATGYLSNVFTADELDNRKAGLNRETKIRFLQKLIDALNTEGDLDDVSASKIVAGKEADRTNLLLQKLAVQAAANNIDRPSKQSRDKKRHRSVPSANPTANSRTDTAALREKQKQEKKKEIEREKRRLLRAVNAEAAKSTSNAIDAAPKKLKKSDTARKRDGDKPREKKKRSDDEKEKQKRTSVQNEPDQFVDEGIGSATPHLSQRQDVASPIPRESSGGTSKAEDSGIADEMNEADRQLSTAMGQFLSIHDAPNSDKTHVDGESSKASMMLSPDVAIDDRNEESEVTSGKRLVSASGRPQTAIGRPGTASARPGPPRIKKTKLDDIDPTAITPQPATFEKSAVIVENEAETTKTDFDDFLVDEEDEAIEVAATNANVAAELSTGDEHGVLVNRIITNAKDIQRDQVALQDEYNKLEATAIKKMRLDVDACGNALQSIAKVLQPLPRTLEFVEEDFHVMLREYNEFQKQISVVKHQIIDRARRDNEEATLLAKMKQTEAELTQIRAHITKTMAHIIDNEKMINEFMASNSFSAS